VTTVTMKKQELLSTSNMNVCLYTYLLPRMQSASFLHSIILSSVACLALSYFSTLAHNGMILKKVTEHEMYILIFATNFV